MLREASGPGGGRAVSAPGGYECWYFDAESCDRRTFISAALFEGFVFHPEYIRRYRRFVRAPTRRAPPVPAEFPVAYLVAYHQGACVARRLVQYEPGALSADPHNLGVRLREHVLSRMDDGAIRLEMNFGDARSFLRLALDFRPSVGAAPAELTWGAGARHHWFVCAPACEVSGTLSGARFLGTGYHDHRWGTEPLTDFGVVLAGRLLDQPEGATFQIARPRRASKAQAQLVEPGDRVARALAFDIEFPVHDEGDVHLPGAIPAAIDFGDVLRLRARRALFHSPVSAHVLYAGRYRGQPCRVIAHGLLPQRMNWPFVRSFVEAAIDTGFGGSEPG